MQKKVNKSEMLSELFEEVNSCSSHELKKMGQKIMIISAEARFMAQKLNRVYHCKKMQIRVLKNSAQPFDRQCCPDGNNI